MSSRRNEYEAVLARMNFTVDDMADRSGPLWFLAVLMDIATSLRLIQKSLVHSYEGGRTHDHARETT